MIDVTKIHAYHEIIAQDQHIQRIAQEEEELGNGLFQLIRREAPKAIHFIGCGSSYFLGSALHEHLQRISQGSIESGFASGSEVILGLRKYSKDTLVIALTRSGNSTETLEALRKAKDRFGVKTAAITCSNNSSVQSIADHTVEMPFVVQKSVAMTGGYTATAFIAQLIFLRLFQPELISVAKQKIPVAAKGVLKESQSVIEGISHDTMSRLRHFSFLGYQEDYGVACEGVIKLTEMALADADAYQPLEYRHGPRAKTGSHSLILLFNQTKTVSVVTPLVSELHRLGALVISTGRSIDGSVSISVPELPMNLEWFLKVIPIHWLGLVVSVRQGLNPDEPQNLTPVVEIDPSTF